MSPRGMTILGYSLLGVGFAVLLCAVMVFESRLISHFSEIAKSLPQKDCFSRDELLHHVWSMYERTDGSRQWLLGSGVAMLVGGFLLGAARKRDGKQDI